MSTSFFKQQDEARRKTYWLLFQFGLAVLCLIGLVYTLAVVLLYKMNDRPPPEIQWFQPTLLLAVAAIVGAIVAGGSMLRIAQLAQGGKSIALMLGGQPVEPNTRDMHERRLLNIVEEMAIASGVPVPAVYLLPDERGINAFAAGHGQGDAVVAVSQGCLDYLTRDEIQGVVGHEFSHVLNGDMTLDLRLLALVSGLMGLAEVGRLIMNIASQSGSSSDKKDNRGAFILLGLGLLVLGLIGAFLGSLIKAAVSRQREFLADASAIQFTRNPAGIGGALKKIGGLEAGSALRAQRRRGQPHVHRQPARRRQHPQPVRHPPAAGAAYPGHRPFVGRQLSGGHESRRGCRRGPGTKTGPGRAAAKPAHVSRHAPAAAAACDGGGRTR